MADISAEIAAFQSAVYGEDVRTAMVNLANKVNNEGSAAAATVAELLNNDIAFLENAVSTQSNYYKTFTSTSPNKYYVFRLKVETAGTYTLSVGTGMSSAQMVDTLGTVDVQANVPVDLVYHPSGAYTTSRLSTATPHSIAIYELINVDDIKSDVQDIKSDVQDIQAVIPLLDKNITAIIPDQTDLDTIRTNVSYLINTNAVHAPYSTFFGYFFNREIGGSSLQICLGFTNRELYKRKRSGNTWTDWIQMIDGRDVISIPRKYVAFGDSTILGAVWTLDQTTQWYQANRIYRIPTRIAHAVGMDNAFTNEAVGGTGYYERSSAGASVTEKIMAYDFTNVELVTICAGINDKGNVEHPLGTASNPASGTICYAIKQIIDWFAENYPAVQLIFMQPLPEGNYADAWSHVGNAGWSNNDFDEQVSTLCHNEHVGYVNWWESNICKQYRKFSGGYSYNPTTTILTGPNYSHMIDEIYYAMLGDFIAGKISALFHGRNGALT